MIFSHAMLRHRYHSSYYRVLMRVLIRQYAYVNDLICAHAYSEIRCCLSIQYMDHIVQQTGIFAQVLVHVRFIDFVIFVHKHTFRLKCYT